MLAVLIAVLAAAAAALLFHLAQPLWDVRGKNVFITGGSQGLGLALAKLLAARGANVVICSRSENKLELAVAQVRAARASPSLLASYVAADVSSFDGASTALAKCPFVPDLVVCCAGGAKPGFFLRHSEADFHAALRTDYWTALSTAHAAAAAMVANNSPGRIVFVSSVLGFMGLIGYSEYSPMKYAIRGLAECLRSELQPHNIAVHAYFPATIYSPGYEEENKTKPEITKAIEGADAGLSPDLCAAALLAGIQRGHFFIVDGPIGSLLRVSSLASAPGNGFLSDYLLALLARPALAAWRRFGADRMIRSHPSRSISFAPP
ncbi:hypothetical protein MCUN1_003272 [Malassezia cuniculi]|uniref:3-dehydrosphinganine reductase n=1 Tax=Malassezia cuniculi TaxID=948313 RepID=A0AAF0EST3_9BASI|nr:hypothetical protein MCUN1_003272 [Malassezia cuniculi]